MLSQLFGSDARVKILNIFLTKPDGQYYLRQLARDLELQVNSVRRELLNLEQIGLIIPVVNEETKSKEKKYYAVSRDFLLFNEIKSLFIKAQLLSTRDFAENVVFLLVTLTLKPTYYLSVRLIKKNYSS